MQLVALIIFWAVVVELLIFLTGGIIWFAYRLYREWKKSREKGATRDDAHLP